MIIRLKVFEQTLSIVDTKSVPRKGSKDYLVLQFTFSSDWKDLNKLCYLQHGEVSQPIDVVDNLVEVPEWFTQQDSFDVTLFGKSGDKEVPTNVVSLRLEKSNTLWEQDAPEPQPSWLAKVIDLNNHPPIPGDNGYWMLWDSDNGTYVESELPLPDMSGIPEGGTSGQLLSKTESGTEWIDPPQSGVQPDWNQNDDTAADYVKNRPFYTGDPKENVLFNGSFVFTIITMGAIGERGVYNGVTDFSPEIGQTYQVSWDGAVYSCVGTEYNTLIALGNLSIMNFGSDTGEPFLMTCGTGSINIYTSKPAATSHTISISMTNPAEIVKIDKKYLPDVRSDWNVNDETSLSYVKNRPFYTGDPVEMVLVEESTATFEDLDGMYGAEFPSTFEATVGETYKVSWDGTVYECACVLIEGLPGIGNLSIVGAGSDTGEPFLMGIDNDETIHIITADTSASHTFSISRMEEVVHQIPIKYISAFEGNAIILPSSTENSTKKFKITVDDSGTLTATEVT